MCSLSRPLSLSLSPPLCTVRSISESRSGPSPSAFMPPKVQLPLPHLQPRGQWIWQIPGPIHIIPSNELWNPLMAAGCSSFLHSCTHYSFNGHLFKWPSLPRSNQHGSGLQRIIFIPCHGAASELSSGVGVGALEGRLNVNPTQNGSTLKILHFITSANGSVNLKSSLELPTHPLALSPSP